MYYGESKEEIKLFNLIKRLENGEVLSKQDMDFIDKKLKEEKPRRLWAVSFSCKNAIQRIKARIDKT